ncbi:MAG: hypothetical protein M0Z51_08195 [Propionibacterium sp.]|nr:hypothetical protein [Propionibacterium sp.]
MWQPDKWLEENYRQMAAELGVEVHELASRVESDPRLAGWMRAQAPDQAKPTARRARKRDDG